LVQTEDYAQAEELFSSEYAYFSSTSTSWLAHAKHYAEHVINRFGLNSNSQVIEVASNDGYLLKNFMAAGIPCIGIEPTASTAAVAEKLGIPVLREFFSESLGIYLSNEGKQADLIVGNNVYAHVPDINDFTRGLKAALKPTGTITLEFPHLMRLIQEVQFDTIYHEHFSYLSIFTVSLIFNAAGLRIWDVDELPTHGGSLRIYGCHKEDPRPTKKSVENILSREENTGLKTIAPYAIFQSRADAVKYDMVEFLIQQKRIGKKVVAYGAAAKGNTLLNYAGIKSDLISYVCDAAESKQGKYLPGSHVPILMPDSIYQTKPDYVVIFPWNISEEIITQNDYIREWGGKFVTFVPKLLIR
jgi:SAM-dependent methyltransferase